MKDFNKRFENLDRDFDRMKKWAIVYGILTVGLWLGLIGFTIWVIITTMRFFSVI